MLAIVRPWRDQLVGVALDSQEIEEQQVPDTHEQIEDFEIVEPPDEGEDQEEAHGGDDSTQEVEEAPEREESAGEEGAEESPDSDSGEEAGGEEEKEQEGEGGGQQEQSAGGGEQEADSEHAAGEDEADDWQDEDEDQSGDQSEESGLKNRHHVFDLEEARQRRLQNAFAVVLSKVAEDLSGWPVEGDEEWDVQAIMERRITRRPLNQCRQSREKERVVLIVDTSGSCQYQAEFFSQLATAAWRLGDVEIYAAPNASLEFERSRHGGWDRIAGYDDGQHWPFVRRTIIFFGDFDGGNSVVEAAKKNTVYWFSCEDRYDDMDEHSWCAYRLADFRGKYYACHNNQDFLRLVRRVR